MSISIIYLILSTAWFWICWNIFELCIYLEVKVEHYYKEGYPSYLVQCKNKVYFSTDMHAYYLKSKEQNYINE